jgi:hypothetical protein
VTSILRVARRESAPGAAAFRQHGHAADPGYAFGQRGGMTTGRPKRFSAAATSLPPTLLCAPDQTVFRTCRFCNLLRR